MRTRPTRLALLLSLVLLPVCAAAEEPPPSGLLFHLSADKSLRADTAAGAASPNFSDKVKIVPDGAIGSAIEAEDEQVLSYLAPGNIHAQRGTVAFFWRPRTPLGQNEFPLFRVGYADHSSWDMVWLRIDWNGHGFDAFVTDTNLARTRVSFTVDTPPAADAWTHLAFGWDETSGVQLFVNGKAAAANKRVAVYDTGLDQFGPNSRIISPHQVQSRFSFLRGGDLDELRIYDQALGETQVASLAGKQPVAVPAFARDMANATVRDAWWRRWGWGRGNDVPPYLADAQTRIRKVEFSEARDLNARATMANDGIAETTWPGVYNRSRIEGRNDYFQLPDWNIYSGSGKSLLLTLPNERWNYLEVVGAATGGFFGAGQGAALATRKPGHLRSFHRLGAGMTGGTLRFDNDVQETPLQEIGAFQIEAGAAPAGSVRLAYTIRTGAATDLTCLAGINEWIRGRFVADERATVVALPEGAPRRQRAAPIGRSMPIVHVLVPADFRSTGPGGPVGRFSYGWEGIDGGLDGIELELPAFRATPTHDGLLPLNIQVKDPLWPGRNLLDVSVSVKPGEKRTLWLDLRDRILPPGENLYLTVVAADADFDAGQLDGAKLQLVFKPRAAALAEHVADRFAQARDNLAFLVEERTNTRKLARYDRLHRDLSDLLRVAPDHALGRLYWSELNPEQGWPAYVQPVPPAGVPLWAFRQVEDLKRVRRFVNWWIDHRQIANGEFGGGLSDDTDLLQQWPGLALMGVDPDKLRDSLDRMVEAVFANGMFTEGLGTIRVDELHAYEEGINGISEAMYLSEGDPKVVERLMATARNYARLTEINPAGHRHFVSNYFSGSRIVREGVWEWSKPNSYLILHPGLLLVDYNGAAGTRKLLLELADGYLAHGKPGTDGQIRFPAEINFRTDAERNGTGVAAALQLFLAAYRWTGDEKYLQPLHAEIRANAGVLATVNADMVPLLRRIADGGEALRRKAQADAGDFARHVSWQVSGDKRHLEELYAQQIQRADQRMYMVTEGEWWSDRVEVPSDELQRARLGGMALKRNQISPGHLVGWRFDAPALAEQVAILLQDATPDRFRVIAHNLSAAPVSAHVTGWNIAPGTWRMTTGIDSNGDDRADGATKAATLPWERGRTLDLVLAPGKTTIAEFELVTAGTPTAARPDLGIGRDDIRVEAGAVTVRVHSLGAVATPAATLLLEDRAGKILAEAPVPSLPAPDDLLPKTADIRVALAPGTDKAVARIRVQPLGDASEITRNNNTVMLR